MVCVGSVFICIITLLLIIIISLQYYFFVCKFVENRETSNTQYEKNTTDKIIINPIVSNPPVIPVDPVKEYDYKKLIDPLQEPTKRVDRYLLGPLEYRNMFNYPVRGYHDSPHWIGLLINNDDTTDNKIIKLFGRQKYPSSNQYEYYTIINMGMDKIKIHIDHTKELYDNDNVEIKELGKIYYVKLNKNDDYEYNPYDML